ncbi:unnamed protein product [Porites evermanni]|uniref:Death domain-containing protein n=1 Tax=Porites evermanni TaxID=104178 RepID=A0ABN8RJW7_9CNID|nr:unnamed protein product [Porites evermanni]
MSESDIHNYKLPYGIGVKWKDLARALGYFEPCIDAIEEEKCHCPKECCIKVLVLWMNREGDEATAARLADALMRIGLKNLADILIYPIDPSQINAFEKEIREMKSQLVSLEAKGSRMSARIKELEEEGSIMSTRIEELEEENQQLRATVEIKDRGEREQEISQVEQVYRTGNKSEELEEQLLIARQSSQEKEEEEGAFFSDADQADREHRIGAQLKNINEQLNTYVTSPLQTPVVKQDQLRLAVRLDLLIRLSENLQELYTETQGMISEAVKCNEGLRRDYYDLAYHGLRAEHFDLVHRVEDLESAQEDMSEEERKEYERLQSYQKDRQRQVEALDKVWRHLFSPVGRLPKTTASDPTGSKSRGCKKVLRLTDPSYLLKKLKLREETDTGAEAPSTSNDEKPEEDSRLMRKKRSSVGNALQSIQSRKKEGGEKQSSSVPYMLMRDG